MKTTFTFVALMITLLLPASAQAGFILQPAAASTNMGSGGTTNPGQVRDQSGLSIGYTSLVTDFDDYIASNPTHDSSDIQSNTWASSSFNTTGNFDFDLGGTFTVESLALWNFGNDSSENVIDFELQADDNAAFSSPTSLGTFSADPDTGPLNAVLPEIFTFTPTSAAFVRMIVTSNNGNPDQTIFGEVAFEAPEVVPEPSSTVLAGLAVFGLAAFAYRRGWSRRTN